MAKPIFLIGFMGSGKSTLGRRLASTLERSFIDLDKYIEKHQNATIPDLFAKHGEDGFRKLEHEALKEVAQLENVIVATGGGAPCFFSNMEIMNNSGISIYLRISPSQLASRLLTSRTERPLIKGLEGEDLENFITEKLAQREVFYNKAQHCIIGDRLNVEDLLPFIK